MEKLSTAKLKKMIGEWLSKPEVRKELGHFSDMDECDYDIENAIDRWGAPKGSSAAQLEEHIWKMWCDSSQWKRREKHKLGDEAEYKFTTTVYDEPHRPGVRGMDLKQHKEPYFSVDMLGDFNKDLLDKMFNDLKAAEGCIFREFEPDNELADNYRLEVITTPDDTEVVGWTVVVD